MVVPYRRPSQADNRNLLFNRFGFAPLNPTQEDCGDIFLMMSQLHSPHLDKRGVIKESSYILLYSFKKRSQEPWAMLCYLYLTSILVPSGPEEWKYRRKKLRKTLDTLLRHHQLGQYEPQETHISDADPIVSPKHLRELIPWMANKEGTIPSDYIDLHSIYAPYNR